jgi:hypothetical protein
MATDPEDAYRKIDPGPAGYKIPIMQNIRLSEKRDRF